MWTKAGVAWGRSTHLSSPSVVRFTRRQGVGSMPEPSGGKALERNYIGKSLTGCEGRVWSRALLRVPVTGRVKR